jgi:hypothetical protein
LFLAAALTVSYWIAHHYAPAATERYFWYVCLSAFLGAVVGASEIVSRYRDEPLLALMSGPAVVYLVLNAAVSAAVYGVLTRYDATLIPALGGDRLLTAIVAGFAAMAVLRSKFFTIRTENGEDVAIGPDAAVSAFLTAADRGIDRTRAAKRLELVARRSGEIARPGEAADYLVVALGAYQNLTQAEKAELKAVFEEIAKLPYPEALKLQAMAYAILRISGEANFNRVMAKLRDYLDGNPDPGEEPH